MEKLFTALTHAVEGTPAVALGAAAIWGVLSILLSPCHLSSIPLIVGFISGQGRTSTARACAVATVFAVGILITIAAVGAITAAAGRMMGDVGRWGNYFVAVIFFAVGLYLLGVIRLPWSGPGQVGTRRDVLVLCPIADEQGDPERAAGLMSWALIAHEGAGPPLCIDNLEQPVLLGHRGAS